MKHQKIELAPPLDRLIVEVSKKNEKKNFSTISTVLGPFFNF